MFKGKLYEKVSKKDEETGEVTEGWRKVSEFRHQAPTITGVATTLATLLGKMDPKEASRVGRILIEREAVGSDMTELKLAPAKEAKPSKKAK